MVQKRFLILPVILFFIISLGIVIPGQSYAQERIVNYDITATIHKDSSVDFTERIQYDFGAEYRHGIFRNIPYVARNSDGIAFQHEINVVSVRIQDFRNIISSGSVPYTTSKSGEYLQVKIGDPNKTITGINTYIISYSVRGGINYFSDHDELYWNATGNEWQIPIQQAKITVDLSEINYPQITNSDVVCYSGVKGSTANDCKISVSPNQAVISTSSTLNPYEGLTFALSFPKNLVDFYQIQEYTKTSDKFDWILVVILSFIFSLNFILPIIMLIFWYFRGRDPKDDRVVVRMYDPPLDTNKKEMSPIEMGTIVDEAVNSRDISGEIIWLAVHKYLIINEKEEKALGLIKTTKITFEKGPKLKEDPEMSELKQHQIDLIKAFGLDKKDSVKLDDISTSLPTKITNIEGEIYKNLTKDGYFDSNPNNTRIKFIVIGFVILFIGLVLPGIVTIVLSFFMPKKTKLGVEAKRHALGLKQFLDSQDRQLEFQEKNYYMFEKLLPYAISFNVAKVWAEKFADLYNYKPDWYTSNTINNINTFNTLNLVNALQRDLSSMETSYKPTSTSSSSGFSSGFSGGSSGGGGGGGGGGSW